MIGVLRRIRGDRAKRVADETKARDAELGGQRHHNARIQGHAIAPRTFVTPSETGQIGRNDPIARAPKMRRHVSASSCSPCRSRGAGRPGRDQRAQSDRVAKSYTEMPAPGAHGMGPEAGLSMGL